MSSAAAAKNPPWPDHVLEPADHFIDTGQPDWQLNACTGPQVRPDWAWSYYADGFRNAGRVLAEVIVEGGRAKDLPVDIAVYPLIYLYRHHLELVLKAMIRLGSAYLRKECPKAWGHSLRSLWESARPIIEAALPDADWSQNPIVTKLLGELDELDPDGQRARYPETRDGKQSFGAVPRIHVRHFAYVAERVSGYFEQVLFGIEHQTEQRDEWEAEMSQHGK